MHPRKSPSRDERAATALGSVGHSSDRIAVHSLVDAVIKPYYAKPKVKLNEGPSFKPKDRLLENIHVDLLLVPSNVVKDYLTEPAGAAFRGSQHELERFMHAFAEGRESADQQVELARLFGDADEALQSEEKKGESYRVLVTANAGTGKTLTFLQLATMKWAAGTIWQRFSIVIAWPLRMPCVHKANSLLQLLRLEELGIVDVEEQNAFNRFIRQNPQELCIILDGFDEVDLNICSAFVQGIIQGERHRGCFLILTSRHANQTIELSDSYPFDKHIEVLGFTRENVLTYVAKVLPRMGLGHCAIAEELDHNPQLAALMRTPFFTAAVCDIFRCHKRLPKSVVDVFSMLVLLVIRQNTGKFCSDWSLVSRPLQETILELGQFLFAMLLRNKIVFSEEDFDEHGLSEDARSVGFLVPCDHPGPLSVVQWQLSHLAVHEFLSALYIAFTCSEPEDISWLVDSITPGRAHMSTFWCLLSAFLSVDGRDALIKGILTEPPKCQQLTAQPGQLLFCSEHNLLETIQVIGSNLDPQGLEQLAQELLSGVVTGSVSDAVEATIHGRVNSNRLDYLTATLRLWKKKVPRANMTMLVAAIERFDEGVARRLSECQLLPGVNQSLSTATRVNLSGQSQIPGTGHAVPMEDENKRRPVPLHLPPGKQLLLLACRVSAQEISCSPFAAAKEQGVTLPAYLSLRPALVGSTGLDFSRFNLSPVDCEAIGSVISTQHDVITQIRFGNCCLDDDCYRYLAAGLGKCKRLKNLDLRGNRLTDVHADHIAGVVQMNSATLEAILTDDNNISARGCALLHDSAHRCARLQELVLKPRSEFNSCAPDDYDMCVQIVSRILMSCREIHTVELCRCVPGDGGLVVIQPALCQLPCLKNLSICDSGLTCGSSSMLNAVIGAHSQRLEWLHLSSNPLGDVALSEVQAALQQCKKLCWLSLSAANLTTASLAILAFLLPHWPGIWRIDLVGNDFSDDDDRVCQFLTALKCHLRKLPLFYLFLPKGSSELLTGTLAQMKSLSFSVFYL